MHGSYGGDSAVALDGDDADPMAIFACFERLGERELDLADADFDDELLDVSLAEVDKMLVGLNPFKMHEQITAYVAQNGTDELDNHGLRYVQYGRAAFMAVHHEYQMRFANSMFHFLFDYGDTLLQTANCGVF